MIFLRSLPTYLPSCQRWRIIFDLLRCSSMDWNLCKNDTLSYGQRHDNLSTSCQLYIKRRRPHYRTRIFWLILAEVRTIEGKKSIFFIRWWSSGRPIGCKVVCSNQVSCCLLWSFHFCLCMEGTKIKKKRLEIVSHDFYDWSYHYAMKPTWLILTNHSELFQTVEQWASLILSLDGAK